MNNMLRIEQNIIIIIIIIIVVVVGGGGGFLITFIQRIYIYIYMSETNHVSRYVVLPLLCSCIFWYT